MSDTTKTPAPKFETLNVRPDAKADAVRAVSILRVAGDTKLTIVDFASDIVKRACKPILKSARKSEPVRAGKHSALTK